MYTIFGFIFCIRGIFTFLIFVILRPCIKRLRQRAEARALNELDAGNSWVTRFDPKPLTNKFAIYTVQTYNKLLANQS